MKISDTLRTYIRDQHALYVCSSPCAKMQRSRTTRRWPFPSFSNPETCSNTRDCPRLRTTFNLCSTSPSAWSGRRYRHRSEMSDGSPFGFSFAIPVPALLLLLLPILAVLKERGTPGVTFSAPRCLPWADGAVHGPEPCSPCWLILPSRASSWRLPVRSLVARSREFTPVGTLCWLLNWFVFDACRGLQHRERSEPIASMRSSRSRSNSYDNALNIDLLLVKLCRAALPGQSLTDHDWLIQNLDLFPNWDGRGCHRLRDCISCGKLTQG